MPNRLLSRVAPLALLTVLLGGCASQPSVSDSWLVPEPLAVSTRTELAIARLSEILNRAELSEEQSAQLFYDRGVMYDSVGLASLARIDFVRALRLKPDLADAYNFVGIHNTISGDFNAAFEAFDSALELQPEHEFAFLNRGIALYYAGKPQLALTDFSAFLALKPDDAYRVIWFYLAQRDVSAEQAIASLKQHQQALDGRVWSTNIVRFLAGDITEAQLLDTVLDELTSAQTLAERLCEVYFYLAKWHERHGRAEQALTYYKQVLATNVYEFVEHRYARLEIARLRGDSSSVAGEDAP